MGFIESLGTTLFLLFLVFMVLTVLWITLRIMSAFIMKLEGFMAAAKSGAAQQQAQTQ